MAASKNRDKDVYASSEDIPVPERNDRVKDKVDEFLDTVIQEKNPTAQTHQTENPTMARTAKSRPSGPSYEARAKSGVGYPRKNSGARTPIRKESTS